MNMLNTAFCYLYNQFLEKLVNEKTDPLVIALDKLIGSECKYCMSIRGIMLGAGVALFNFYGLLLIALAILFAIGERKFLCKV